MSTDVLVTGASGFIGRAAVERLAAEGLRVVACDLAAEAPADLAAALPAVQWRQLDVRDAAAVRSAMAEAEPRVVAHLAAAMDVTGKNPSVIVDTNIVGTVHVAEAALAAGVKRLVHGSSVMVYGPLSTRHEGMVTEQAPVDPCTSYGAAKVFIERLLAEDHYRSRLESAALRFTTVYGPGRLRGGACAYVVDAFLAASGAAEMRINTTQRTDVIHVRDAAAAVVAAVTAQAPVCGVYNVGHHQVTGADMLAAARAVVGPFSVTEHDGEASAWPFQIDCTRSRRELGWQPVISLREGAESVIDWLAEADLPITDNKS